MTGTTRLPVVAALLAATSGCFSYSPHELPSSPRDVNADNLVRLAATEPAQRLRFAVLGDVQRSLDHAVEAVRALNAVEGLEFVVQVGDFTDLGLPDEFELMADVVGRLSMPWFVVIGNHDLLGNGGAVYDRMFGPRNFDFVHGRTRFVVLDTNSREYGFGRGVPDLQWLGERLAPAPDHDRVVVLSHVWPYSGDFDPGLSQPFRDRLAAAGVTLSLHGHDHHYRERTEDGVAYYVADHVEKGAYLLVEEDEGGDLVVRRVEF